MSTLQKSHRRWLTEAVLLCSLCSCSSSWEEWDTARITPTILPAFLVWLVRSKKWPSLWCWSFPVSETRQVPKAMAVCCCQRANNWEKKQEREVTGGWAPKLASSSSVESTNLHSTRESHTEALDWVSSKVLAHKAASIQAGVLFGNKGIRDLWANALSRKYRKRPAHGENGL